jgi:transcription initiation factor TFIIIB Brf1 subunit/transcription initiation factor TFIIB
MIRCPLCHQSATPFWEDARRAYFQCPDCGLVFADPASHLTREDEKRVYDQHENDPSDARYRQFLGRLAQPLLARLQPGMSGLDYGSGPGPTLSMLLEEAGMTMAIYDPIYAPDRTVLERTYDFVTCSEVAEHFRVPGEEWKRLVSLVHPGGWLGIMTKQVLDRERFPTWHYKNDPTHVCFYSQRTWKWLGDRHRLLVTRIPPDVVILQKKEFAQNSPPTIN